MYFLIGVLSFFSLCVLAQENTIAEGYLYVSKNWGYLEVVQRTAVDIDSQKQIAQLFSNEEGYFTFEAPIGKSLKISILKDMFYPIVRILLQRRI